MTSLKKLKEIESYLKKKSDQRLLNLVYALIQEDKNEDDQIQDKIEGLLTNELMDEMDEIIKAHKLGKTKSYSIKQVISNAKKSAAAVHARK